MCFRPLVRKIQLASESSIYCLEGSFIQTERLRVKEVFKALNYTKHTYFDRVEPSGVGRLGDETPGPGSLSPGGWRATSPR